VVGGTSLALNAGSPGPRAPSAQPQGAAEREARPPPPAAAPPPPPVAQQPQAEPLQDTRDTLRASPVAGSWTLAGDARIGVLRSAEGVEFPPGPVPAPGRYELVATFADGSVTTLVVQWSAGDRRTFRCASSVRLCIETP